MALLLPLFPLQLVVFPGSAVPLHIFEPRYREMVGNAHAAGTEFGIVLAREGGIVNTGCTVMVEAVLETYPDGRFDVMARGQRRFIITALNQDKDYLQGEVEYFIDDDEAPASLALRHEAVEAFHLVAEAAAAGKEDAEIPEVDEDHPQLSFQLGAYVDDLDFRNLIQRSRSEAERLRAFIDISRRYAERTEYAAKMKRTAPLNGHGHKSVN